MKPFSLNKLAALTLALSLMVPPAALAQERDDFLDDFLPEAPLQPLDQIIDDPAPDGWVNEVLGDPGAVPPSAPTDDAAQADAGQAEAGQAEAGQVEAGPDTTPHESATPEAESGFALPEGWTWHEITISESVAAVSYPVRIAFPDEFYQAGQDVIDFLGAEDGSVLFSETDLLQMAEEVTAGQRDPYGLVVTIGLSRRPQLSSIENDRGFTETSRGTVILENGIVMARLSGVVEDGGVTMALALFESQVPIGETVYLALMFTAYGGDPAIDALAESVVQSLSLRRSGDTTETREAEGPLALLGGAVIVDGLPEGWRLVTQRDHEILVRSTGGYQGFINIETADDAQMAADLSVTFTGAVTESRGEIMGVPARIFEGRKDHDGFLQGYNMVGGPRFLALPDQCLPGGVPVTITWAGSPQWFEQGAFERFFDAARFDGLVPCAATPVAPVQTAPPAADAPAVAPPSADPASAPSGQPTFPPGADDPAPSAPADPSFAGKPDLSPDADATPPVAPATSGSAVAQPEAAALGAPPAAAQPSPDAAQLQAEILFWQSVQGMNTPAAFEAYLARYPDGQFAPLARLRVAAAPQPTEAMPGDPPPNAPLPGAPRSEPTAAQAEVAVRECEGLTGDSISDGLAAAAACRAALSLRPDAGDLHYRLARALQASGAPADAIPHLQRAADAGVPAAMSALGVAFRQGQGVVQDDRMAIHWYRAGAEAGDARAMNNLGFMLNHGLGGYAPNPVEAAYWYERAAEAGSVFGMNNIGRFYLDGHGVAQDYAQALHWLQRGAEAGHLPAMNNLGTILARGLVGPVDHAQALMWYRRAADEGHAPAMANVGLALSHGWGVAANPADAAFWFEQSIRRGAGDSVLGVLDGLPREVIRVLQLRLNGAGVYAGAADGVPGPQTRNAVRALDGVDG